MPEDAHRYGAMLNALASELAHEQAYGVPKVHPDRCLPHLVHDAVRDVDKHSM